MVTMKQVEGFASLRKIAVVGASRKGGKFCNMVLKDLGDRYSFYAVHPDADEVAGVRSYRS